MAKIEVLSIDLIRMDGGTQARLACNQDVVDDYAEAITANDNDWPFEPIVVFFDGSDYFLADGFHRTLAAIRLKRSSITCLVHRGTSKDAKIFGMTANDTHGLRMSREDKRACVIWLLEYGGKMTQAEIAVKAGVSRRTVTSVVADRKPKNAQVAQSTSETQGNSSSPTSESNEDPEVSLAEQVKKLKNVIQQHIDKAGRLVDDLHDLKPNKTRQQAVIKALQDIKLW